MEQDVAVGVLCIAVGGVAAQWMAWRFRLPAIVLLFGAGLLAGPVFGLLAPSHAAGAALRPVVGLAVAVVVFEGGLALDVRELRAAGAGVLRLTAIALPISFALGTAAARFIAGMGWGPAALFGAITVVTGPTVVLPLLRHTRLQPRAAALLRWEAIVNDPVGAILATMVLEVLVAGHVGGREAGRLGLELAGALAAAAALGVGAALLVRWAFLRDQVPEVLKTPVLLALALGVYAVSNLAMAEAGLMAATVFGVALANMRVPGLAELRRFKEALVVMLVSALFIVLTADLDRAVLARLSLPVVLLTAAMLLVVRPLAILLATARSGLTRPERALAAWIAPRGIVAAAVAGVAGLRLQAAGYAGAELVMPAVFALIAATMVLHGFSLAPLAGRLNLRLGGAPGLAIVGASPWTTDLASALHGAGVPVMLVDIYPGALAPARARGISVLQAEILSEHGEEGFAGQAMDYLIAATPNTIYNGLVCTRLAPELGRERVFQLAPSDRGRLDRRHGLSRDWRGKVLGDPAWDYAAFERKHEQGWRFEVVEAGTAAEGGSSGPGHVPLIVVSANGALGFASVEDAAAVAAGPEDKVVVMAPPPGVSRKWGPGGHGQLSALGGDRLKDVTGSRSEGGTVNRTLDLQQQVRRR
jgi:NhaP-type Na+/H+ or K+/H+ antiporter